MPKKFKKADDDESVMRYIWSVVLLLCEHGKKESLFSVLYNRIWKWERTEKKTGRTLRRIHHLCQRAFDGDHKKQSIAETGFEFHKEPGNRRIWVSKAVKGQMDPRKNLRFGKSKEYQPSKLIRGLVIAAIPKKVSQDQILKSMMVLEKKRKLEEGDQRRSDLDMDALIRNILTSPKQIRWAQKNKGVTFHFLGNYYWATPYRDEEENE